MRYCHHRPIVEYQLKHGIVSKRTHLRWSSLEFLDLRWPFVVGTFNAAVACLASCAGARLGRSQRSRFPDVLYLGNDQDHCNFGDRISARRSDS